MKIGIIITTFLRDELLFECINSILKHWNDDYYLIVIDQGNPSVKKVELLHNKEYLTPEKGEYIKTEFDIGPLKARNIAIRRIQELNIPFTLMSADSIIFDKIYDFNIVTEFLNREEDRFLCSFDLKGRLPWECDMKKTDRFLLDVPKRNPLNFMGEKFQPIDLARNFFIAKTKLLLDSPYDEDRKMMDHETSFWRWKEKGYKCFYYKEIQALYELFKPPEYLLMRSRISGCKMQMKEKYNLKGWVSYSTELQAFWDKWRALK